MGHMLHARARTTPEVRREIQNSQESLMTLAQRYGVNIKTIAKWRKRDFVYDAPMGPKFVHSKSLTDRGGCCCGFQGIYTTASG